MANGTTSPAGGSVAQTAGVSGAMAGGMVLLVWLVKPSWPPPQDVLFIVYGASAPLLHLIGRAIFRKLAAWAGDPEIIPPPSPPAVPAGQPQAVAPTPIPQEHDE